MGVLWQQSSFVEEKQDLVCAYDGGDPRLFIPGPMAGTHRPCGGGGRFYAPVPADQTNFPPSAPGVLWKYSSQNPTHGGQNALPGEFPPEIPPPQGKGGATFL